MESTTVIKVKYGDTLRRFSARVTNGEFEFDMDELREKICSLFKFAPDAELKLEYVDEDGDVVTLVDDVDLVDVVSQGLNPLRITVVLTRDKNSKSSARSSGSSTPLRSRWAQPPPQDLNSGVPEMLKSIPEPLREPLSKMTSDLAHMASKATSNTPILADLVDGFSKLGLSYLNQVSEFQAAAVSNPDEADGSKASDEVSLNSKFGEPSSKISKVAEKPKVTSDDNVNQSMEFEASQFPGLVALLQGSGLKQSDVDSLGNADSKSVTSGVAAAEKQAVTKQNLDDLSGTTPVLPNKTENGSQTIKMNPSDAAGNSSGPSSYMPSNMINDGNVRTGITGISSELKRCSPSFPPGGYDQSKPRFSPSPVNECPFGGMPLGNGTGGMSNAPPHEAAFRRSYSHTDGIFHRGIRCDGCGVHPITGPRFKSKVKEDYDLCSICFAEMGNDADYIRLDRPAIYRHPLSFKGLYDHRTRVCPPSLPHIFRGPGVKPSRPKLDSRFILDVNVLDGTIMAPSTAFTKIWRMRNNGTIVWPQGCRLVWIGGDRLTNNPSVELEVGAGGLAVEQELDVAVDFVAPELPGRYISYWRMASPFGQKFGQRVWVLIQVDASLKEPIHEPVHGFNLNWPPASVSATAPEVENLSPEPVVEDHLTETDNMLVKTEEPSVDEHVNKQHEANFPINNSLLVGGALPNPFFSGPSSSAPVPVIDLTDLTDDETTEAPASAVVQGSGEDGKEKTDVEATLLKELEGMGFTQVDLNKKVLRKNKYDLEQSVDDLCGVSEWDPMLEELEEMGFHDTETNRRLLKKNNGSIKRVVMDLIAGE